MVLPPVMSENEILNVEGGIRVAIGVLWRMEEEERSKDQTKQGLKNITRPSTTYLA
jgi:hypothetical protein